jgi:glycosyltransferase involved in cell wall biosynthesis
MPNKRNPLVSLIVPVYNVEPYLEQCVDSITRQTYANLEIILVDDGSTDGSGAMCDALAANDVRIEVIHQSNMGLSMARNNGMRAAEGKYIQFVDSDDYIDADCVRLCVEIAERGALDVVLFDAECFGDLRLCGCLPDILRRKKRYGFMSGCEMYCQMMENDNYFNNAWAYQANAEFLRKNKLEFIPRILYEDAVFTFLLLMRAEKCGHINRMLYHYRIRGGSITMSAPSGRAESYCVCFREIYEFLRRVEDTRLKAAIETQLDRLFTDFVGNCCGLTVSAECLTELDDIFKNLPLSGMCYGNDIDIKRRGKTIWYGFGDRTKSLLKKQVEKPAEIWDADSAKHARNSYGMRCCAPRFESLTEDELLLVCVDNLTVLEEVKSQCARAVFANVIHWREYFWNLIKLRSSRDDEM